MDGILYAVGGEGATGEVDTVYAYDPVGNSWSTKHALPIAVQSPVVQGVNHKLYCIGGYNNGAGVVYQDVYEYDPTNDAAGWTKKTDMPTGREDMGSAVIGTKIYVFGGLGPPGTPTKKLEIYDTSNDTWTTGADMPDYKMLGDFGCASGGKVYGIGGTNTFADYPTLHTVTTVFEYDPNTNTWTTKATAMPLSTCYKEVVALGDYLYFVSGCTTNTTTFTNAIYAYKPSTDTWEFAGYAPLPARGIGLAVYDGKIYACGGWTTSPQTNVYRFW